MAGLSEAELGGGVRKASLHESKALVASCIACMGAALDRWGRWRLAGGQDSGGAVATWRYAGA